MTTNQHPIPWGRTRRDAGHFLVASSCLAGHDWFERHVTLRHRDDGPDTMDVEALDDYAWSSGERVLVGLFLTFAGYPRNCQMRDLFALDPENRKAAGDAVALACSEGWHPSMQSYSEAF